MLMSPGRQTMGLDNARWWWPSAWNTTSTTVSIPRMGWRYNNMLRPLVGRLRACEFATLGQRGPERNAGALRRAWQPDLPRIAWTTASASPAPSLDSRAPGLRQAHVRGGQAGRADAWASSAAPDKVTAWGLYIYDKQAVPAAASSDARTRAPGPPIGPGSGTAATKQRRGPLPEGVYWAVLSARYTTGQTAVSPYAQAGDQQHARPWPDLALDPDSHQPQGRRRAYRAHQL